jgi:hypothetical protein
MTRRFYSFQLSTIELRPIHDLEVIIDDCHGLAKHSKTKPEYLTLSAKGTVTVTLNPAGFSEKEPRVSQKSKVEPEAEPYCRLSFPYY